MVHAHLTGRKVLWRSEEEIQGDPRVALLAMLHRHAVPLSIKNHNVSMAHWQLAALHDEGALGSERHGELAAVVHMAGTRVLLVLVEAEEAGQWHHLLIQQLSQLGQKLLHEAAHEAEMRRGWSRGVPFEGVLVREPVGASGSELSPARTRQKVS